jgi:uncharacterized protein YndB with AHSA1/START domain
MTDLKVELEKTINAPIEKVFDAWLDAKTLSRFMTPRPGMPEPRTEVDARQGGGFTIYMLVGDREIPHKGQYLEIVRPKKLVFTWETPFSVPESTVTVRFTAVDSNTTHINLIHLKFRDEEARGNHQGGWTAILDKLTQVSENCKMETAV